MATKKNYIKLQKLAAWKQYNYGYNFYNTFVLFVETVSC